MATKSNYGQTWWGAQWLNALTQIDYDNRLPRGRNYANKGAVAHLEIEGNHIHAKVKGSRPQPYIVEIEVPQMSVAQGKSLLDELAQDPVIISKILNRELDPAVLERARSLKIPVFPSRWSDLKMHCSCPDWAVPCKHLAAAIYLLSREIDGNSFLVFSLKGINLVQELKSRNISIEHEAEALLPKADALISSSSEPRSGAGAGGPTGDSAALDYSILPDLSEPLIGVLPPNPHFFEHGDFRQTYEKLLKRVAKGARMALDATAAKQEGRPAFTPDDKPQIGINAQYENSLSGLSSVSNWPALIDGLSTLAEAVLPDLQPEVAALYHVQMASLHLLAKGAVLPQIFDTGHHTTAVRWLPAMLEPTVRQMISRLGQAMPSGLVIYNQDKQGVRLTGEEQALILCSLFLDTFIQQWAQVASDKAADSKVLALFFGKKRCRFDGPGEGAIPAGIQVWLSRLHLVQQPHPPVLLLEESGKGFELSIAVESRDGSLAMPVPLAEVLKDNAWQAARYGVLQTISLLAEYFPALNSYVSAGADKPIALSTEGVQEFLFNTLPIIRLLGICALLPKGLEHLLRPRLSMRVSGKGGSSPGFLKMEELLQFDWTVAIGGEQLTRAEFTKLVNKASGIVQFKGAYVYLDPAEIERLFDQMDKAHAPNGPELLRIALAEEYGGSPIVLDERARDVIQSLTNDRDIPQPAGINAALRPYQVRGFSWLYRNLCAGFGSVIADDMGLGKTLQVITTLLKLKEEGGLHEAKAMVVVPTSLLTNWEKEIARFAPGLSVAIYHGPERELAQERPDVLLTTYGVVRTDQNKLRKLSWRLVITDEAQNIKNPGTAQTKAVKSIPTQNFIAMSGTPVENRLSEYWSIMDFANRGFMGNLPGFTKEFAKPIQSDHDQSVIQRFKRVTAPFLLRRLKSDKSIISDLPDKIEQDQFCELTPQQAALYESVTQEALRVINGESDTFKRQGLVLQMIMALKQTCNHPAQYLKGKEGDACLSGKVERLLELLDAIHASHEKVLVFTQFREMGELLSVWIKERFGRAPQFLHGGVPRSKRDEMVERFQNDPTEWVFLLSLKAGGTGLNLTAASNVIHFDLWWNPAVEAQATDRAYRIGQQRNVQVHRLITRATFEERINEMIQSKKELAELTVGSGEKWIGNLSNEELNDVFRLR